MPPLSHCNNSILRGNWQSLEVAARRVENLLAAISTIYITDVWNTQQFKSASWNTTFTLRCIQCGQTYQTSKRAIVTTLKRNQQPGYCSRACVKAKLSTFQLYPCTQCAKEISVRSHIISKSMSKRFFCGLSCAATYNNAHKKKGVRVSKLECWIRSKLEQDYQHLEIHYNRRDAIDAELDIFIPSLSLAFELNGIYHYEPIHGQEKLSATQRNDNRKLSVCAEKRISLCVIDVSRQKKFTSNSSECYWAIVQSIINENLALATREEYSACTT